MKIIKYFFEFIFVIIFFSLFKILGPKKSSYTGGKIFEIIGPIFRSEKIIHLNIKRVIPDIDNENLKKLTRLMWNTYGRVFAEFVSGHLSNFELKAMELEKAGINLSAIYRPLNNVFLNPLIERIRKKYICKNQIKKGIGGIKKLISFKKNNFSTALMIDQRVSEGILSKFFNQRALTTTIPAQLVKKFSIPVIPVYIERVKDINFKITIKKPIFFSQEKSISEITDELNIELEKMILKKPEQWIWSHNRWK